MPELGRLTPTVAMPRPLEVATPLGFTVASVPVALCTTNCTSKSARVRPLASGGVTYTAKDAAPAAVLNENMYGTSCCAMTPLPVPVAVVPDTVTSRGVAVPMLLLLLLVSQATC